LESGEKYKDWAEAQGDSLEKIAIRYYLRGKQEVQRLPDLKK
jgi:hypothetical protein